MTSNFVGITGGSATEKHLNRRDNGRINRDKVNTQHTHNTHTAHLLCTYVLCMDGLLVLWSSADENDRAVWSRRGRFTTFELGSNMRG